MPREKKAQVIDSLQRSLSECSIGILTDYRGLSALEMTGLRRTLREAGVNYRVVKNTLARFAAQRIDREDMVGIFDGPVAIAFGYGEITWLAKLLIGYIRDSKTTLTIKGAFLPDQLLTAEDVKSLATLPSREVMLARMVAGVQSPLSALVGHLTAPIQGVIGVLQSRIQQLEGS